MHLATDNETIRATHELERSITKLRVRISHALRRMADQTGGSPTRASGADAGGNGGGMLIDKDQHGPEERIPSTTVETAAINARPDIAERDRAALRRKDGQMLDLSREVDGLVNQYTGRRLSSADLAEAHKAMVDDMWCANCISHGVTQPRKTDGLHCGWCYSFHAEHGQYPPKPLVELHSQGRRLHQRDIDRALAGKPQVKGRKRAKR